MLVMTAEELTDAYVAGVVRFGRAPAPQWIVDLPDGGVDAGWWHELPVGAKREAMVATAMHPVLLGSTYAPADVAVVVAEEGGPAHWHRLVPPPGIDDDPMRLLVALVLATSPSLAEAPAAAHMAMQDGDPADWIGGGLEG